MITGNIIYASVRFGSELKIPFTHDKVLLFHKGATFYICLIGGKFCHRNIQGNCLLVFDC